MSIIKNTAGQNIPLGVLINATTGAEITSAATVTITLDNAGNGQASAGTLTYRTSNGWWYAPTQGETNANAIMLYLTASGAVPLARAVITVDYARTAVDAVLADTNELQGDWADGGRLDLILDARMPTTHIAATGGTVDHVTLVDTTTTNTDMRGTDNAALASSLTTTDGKVDTISTNVSTLLTRIPAALFSGMTSLAQWLGLMAGKQTANSVALAEIKATGAGSGTYSETTDSLEAVRDRGDAAWTGGSAAITFTPVTSTVSTGEVVSTHLIAYQASAPSYVFTIVDSDGNAVNLSGKTVRFIAFQPGSTTSSIFSRETGGSGITVSGAGNNEVTVTLTTSNTADPESLEYILWNTTDSLVLGAGRFEIRSVPKAAV